MCCGQKREAMKMPRTVSAPTSAASVLDRPVTSAPELERRAVVYQGRGAFLVAGAQSREVYQFSAATPEQLVDSRDIEAFVASGFFHAKQ